MEKAKERFFGYNLGRKGKRAWQKSAKWRTKVQKMLSDPLTQSTEQLFRKKKAKQRRERN